MNGARAMWVVRSSERGGWSPLVDPPGEAGTGGFETTAFTSPDGKLTVGLWNREPDTWSFERSYDEVALILEGRAEMEGDDGRIHRLEAGTIVVTPNGAKGTWRIAETLTKCFAIYESGQVGGDTTIRSVAADADSHDWTEIPTVPGDANEPGEETVVFRSIDTQTSVGLWRRVPETGPMDLTDHHEVACLLEGEVDVATASGEVLAVGPGDVLVTPRGSRAEWRAKTRVRKLWVAYHGG